MGNHPEIGIGVIGGGYMGKAHSVAMKAVGAVFNTVLRPRCAMICTTTEQGAMQKAQEFGFERSTADWRQLVGDSSVDAIIIATPADSHHDIAVMAAEMGKPIYAKSRWLRASRKLKP